MTCVQGIGSSFDKTTEALDVVDGVGETHPGSLRSAKWETETKTGHHCMCTTMGFCYPTNPESSVSTRIFSKRPHNETDC